MIELTEFKDKEKGKDVFIFGSGPSLHFFDMDIIKDRPTICVNGSILKIKRPSYYLTSDGHQTIKTHWKLVQDGTFPILYSSEGVSSHISKYGPIDKWRSCSFQKEHITILNPCADKLIWGKSSMHCAIHFAVILGAKRIILVGADCECGDDERFRFYDYEGESKDNCTVREMKQVFLNVLDPGNNFRIWIDFYKLLKATNPDVNIECLGGKLVRDGIYPSYNKD